MNIIPEFDQANLVTAAVDQLAVVPLEQRNKFAEGAKTQENHRQLMRSVDAMRQIEAGGSSANSETALPSRMDVAAWNLERCLFPEESAELLLRQQPDVILLSEVDNGMARTNQLHTARRIAELLGMHYVFGVEFLELDLGSVIERNRYNDDHNQLGWHGNAVLSKVKPQRSALIRLDDHGHWYCSELNEKCADQPRVGGRMAIASIFQTHAGPLCAVSVHLESAALPAHREQQMVHLLDQIDRFAPSIPVIIGGDLNTGVMVEDRDWRREGLFETARARGYGWENNADGVTVRESLISTGNHPRDYKLDWFCHKGVGVCGAEIVPALADNGLPLSDHELIIGRFAIV